MLSLQIPSDSVCVLVWKMQCRGGRYTETRLLCWEERESCSGEVNICAFHNLFWSCTVSSHLRDILV